MNEQLAFRTRVCLIRTRAICNERGFLVVLYFHNGARSEVLKKILKELLDNPLLLKKKSMHEQQQYLTKKLLEKV